jgi:hypothetical protein
VTATHEATGNTFVAVTDAAGKYRLSVRIGSYTVTGELSGFSTLSQKGIEVQVGQEATFNVKLPLAGVQETLTVTSEAPLVNITQSQLGGNIDQKQMQEIPLNGRNWMSLTQLAPGSRSTGAIDAPIEATRESVGMTFQLNVDGQQVTTLYSNSNNMEPRFSRDAIAEFKLITNHFDAVYGRSQGVQVVAVTKSGTNKYGGSVSGFFRDDSFNAKDFITQTVLPYSNQQVSVTFGGPIKLNRAHFFAHYEYEREPQTMVFTSPWPRFNITDLTAVRLERKSGGRYDQQLGSKMHMMVRATEWNNRRPFRTDPGATTHPSAIPGGHNKASQIWASLTQTLTNSAINEISGGFARTQADWEMFGYAGRGDWPDGARALEEMLSAPLVPGLLVPDTGRPPLIILRGYNIGSAAAAGAGGSPYPQNLGDHVWQVKDTLTWLKSGWGGRHDVKVGGEYMHTLSHIFFGNGIQGTIDAQGGPVPANVEDLFPAWNDWRTWNLAALNPIVRSYSLAFGVKESLIPRDVGALWFQDDWSIGHLTLNLGTRYDVSIGSLGDRLAALPPVRPADKIYSDWNNIAPRFGAAYAMNNGRTVIRGGWGKFFTEMLDSTQLFTNYAINTAFLTVFNDNQPGFVLDPFRGQTPTLESIRASGTPQAIQIIPGNNQFQTPFSYQASVGVQRELTRRMSVQADYVWTGERNLPGARNINLTYNPATGANYPFQDASRRVYPQWTTITGNLNDGRSNYHGLQTAFTRRFGNRWQASGTYTLSFLKDARGVPDVGFPLAPDMGGEYTYANGDQRHRAVFNGIWELPYNLQLSGLYFASSGFRYSTTYGGDLRNQGVSTEGRLRLNGTIVPRNNFVGEPIHRVDMRVQKRFRLGGSVSADGIVEVFNLFNRANYGAWTTVEVLASYGRPARNSSPAYSPRVAQFAFRLTF